jgi:hypothetical protein
MGVLWVAFPWILAINCGESVKERRGKCEGSLWAKVFAKKGAYATRKFELSKRSNWPESWLWPMNHHDTAVFRLTRYLATTVWREQLAGNPL